MQLLIKKYGDADEPLLSLKAQKIYTTLLRMVCGLKIFQEENKEI
jgi:hypothetical protein